MELTDIRFPPGSKAISGDMNPAELLKSLKRCCKFFSQLEQDQEEEKKIYSPFCSYISESEFLQEITDNNARIHLACIFADLFRLHAPENPFQGGDKVKDIFLFLNEQLAHLKDVKSALFSKAYHILENVATIKSYNICIDLLDPEASEEVFCGLFKLFFSIVNSGHDKQLKTHMLDVMSFIVTDSGLISLNLLNIILECLLEKTQRMNPSAYELAQELLRKIAGTIEPVVMVFFQNILLGDHQETNHFSQSWPKLICELYKIAPTLLHNTIPQLELKLRTDVVNDRLQVVQLLARMFSAKDSDLPYQFTSLWSCFICRFNDIDPGIRAICVNFCADMIINHGEDGPKGQAITEELISFLKLRRHDTEEVVRVAVVVAIRAIAMRDLQLASDEVLEFLKERLLDKKRKVREAAVRAVADIYKKYSDQESPRLQRRKLNIFKSQLLHVYYTQNLEDCVLLERILVSSLVPYSLPNDERMKRLLELFCTVDNHALKAIIEMFRKQKILCDALRQILTAFSIKQEEERNKKIWPKIVMISMQLQAPLSARENVKKFIYIAKNDVRISRWLEYLVSEQYTCQKIALAVRDILKKLDADGVSKSTRQTVQQMLERIVLLPVLIDPSSLLSLFKLTCDLLHGISHFDEVVTEEMKLRGMDLLQVQAQQNPHIFATTECFEQLLSILRHDQPAVVEKALIILQNTAYIIEEKFKNIRTILLPELKAIAKTGTPKQAKYAVFCINAFGSVRETPLMQVFDYCKENASDGNSSSVKTLLTTLGCISQCLPETAGKLLKGFIASTVVKQIIMKTKQQSSAKKKKEVKWCEKSEVTKETSTKIVAMKCMVRWLCGMNSNELDCGGSTLRLLQHTIHNNGDLMNCGNISKADMGHLRLHAALCVLRIAECSEYRSLISSSVYQELAMLLTDEIFEVRRHFLGKLYQALFKFKIDISFMSLFCMVCQEKIKEHRSHGTFLYHQLVKRYREVNKQNASHGRKYSNYLMPEYVLPYTIHMLASDPDLKGIPPRQMLSRIKECLNFILDPLLTRDHPETFGFIKRLAEMIKQSRSQDALDDEARNETLYAVCDLTLQSVLHRSGQYAVAIIEPPDDSVKKFLPSKWYTEPNGQENHMNYLPREFLIVPRFIPTISRAEQTGRPKSQATTAKQPTSGSISGKLVAVSKVPFNSRKKDSVSSNNTPATQSLRKLAASDRSPINSHKRKENKTQLKRKVSSRSSDSSSDDEQLSITKQKLMLAKKKKLLEMAETENKGQQSLSSENDSFSSSNDQPVSESASMQIVTEFSSRPKRASAGSKMFDFLRSTKRTPTKKKEVAREACKNSTNKKSMDDSAVSSVNSVEEVVRRSGRRPVKKRR